MTVRLTHSVISHVAHYKRKSIDKRFFWHVLPLGYIVVGVEEGFGPDLDDKSRQGKTFHKGFPFPHQYSPARENALKKNASRPIQYWVKTTKATAAIFEVSLKVIMLKKQGSSF